MSHKGAQRKIHNKFPISDNLEDSDDMLTFVFLRVALRVPLW
jgi:hypothetical protein